MVARLEGPRVDRMEDLLVDRLEGLRVDRREDLWVDRLEGQRVGRMVARLEGPRVDCFGGQLGLKMVEQGASARFSWPVAQAQALLPALRWVLAQVPFR